jgi:hypothetical protein
MLQLYATHARRIRSLELHMEELAIRKFNHTLLTTRFPILDDLQIHMHPYVPMEDFDALCSAIHALRALRHLTLCQYDPWDRFSQEPASVLPWGRLETLELVTSISLTDAVHVLKSCVSATTIRLCGIEPTYTMDNNGTTTASVTLPEAEYLVKVTLPRLTKLVLEGGISPIPLLQSLSLPNLETLLVISSRPCPMEYKPLSDILGAQNRFSPTLKSVALQNHYTIFSQDVFSFMRGTRALGLVPDVSVAYAMISQPQLYDLDYLVDAQVTIGERGFPDTQTNPPAAQLIVWDDKKSESGSPSAMNINIGWSYTMGDLKYNPLAFWNDAGVLTPLADLDAVFASVARSAAQKMTLADAVGQAHANRLARGEDEESEELSEGEFDSDEEVN